MNTSLPTGTVTFLFTDMEGSTELLKRLREQYADLLADQRRILRAAFEKWGGQEVDTQGDAFFVSFPRATEAVAAAVEIQRALAGVKWPEGVPVRVRMGLHTGEPWVAEEGYVGLDVHRAARIAHVGHGGQVLLSETTTSLVRDDLPTGVSLEALGSFPLKDIDRPEPIHQLVIAELPGAFPPLKTKQHPDLAPQDRAALALSCFGGFQAFLNGQSIEEFESAKARALLIYLAVEADRPHRRDMLTGLLWPDMPDRSARTSLRSTLARLRRAIGDRDASPSYLHITRESLQYNAASDQWIDVTELKELADRATLEDLEKAVQLYRGEFLEGFQIKDSAAFEDWYLQTRERLQRQASAALLRLAKGLPAQGESERALDYAWRLLEFEPWHEEGHQQVMYLLALTGQRSAALAHYDTCQRLLSQELGVEPAPETTRLYEQIRGGEFTVAEHSPIPEIAPTPGPPPYKGLQYFNESDASLFFGRENLTTKLVSQLDPAKQKRFLAVVGASGSGKSSIVRAGLIPALQSSQPMADGQLPPEASSNWSVYILTPTAHPLEALAVSLTPSSGSLGSAATLMDDMARDSRSLRLHLRRIRPEESEHLLLVVDQFEELFTQCRDKGERQAFVNNLMNAAQGEGPAIIVITLRADFYAHCGEYAILREALEKDQVYIGPMNREELRRAMTGPAEFGDWRFEPGLVDLMLREVEHAPGGLPLLSHALLETWRRRRGRIMTLEGYNDCGGVRGAIAHTADRVLVRLDPSEQRIARNIFLRLTELGHGTEDTRRRARLSELLQSAEDEGAVERLLKILADARLVTTSEAYAEVAHEALIREWPTLRAWLEEDRAGLEIHRHLTDAAQEWERLTKDPGELYRGARLAAALEWVAENEAQLSPLEHEFLSASQELAEQKEREREAQRQRELAAAQQIAAAEQERADIQARSARRLRTGALVLAGVAVIAVVLAVFAFIAQANAQREAAVNHSLVLSASAQDAQENGEVDLALALVLEAVNMDQPPPEARRTLSAVALGAGTRTILTGHSHSVRDVAISPDGKKALTISCAELNTEGDCTEGEMILWDLEAGAELRRFDGHNGWVNSVAFSPDGNTVLSGSGDGALILWEVETGQLIHRFEGHTGGVNSVAFNPEGQTAISGSEDATLILWDLSTRDTLQRFEAHTDRVNQVTFSPDGQTALSTSDDSTLILWNVSTGEEIRRFVGHDAQVADVVFVLNGSTILSSGDNSLRLWDIETGQEIRQQGFGSWTDWLASSPDGRTVLVGGIGPGMRLWDIERWQEVQVLKSPRQAELITVEAAAISPNGLLVLSGSSDGSLRLWNLAGQAKFRRFETDGTPLSTVSLSPDGKHLLTGDLNDQIILWDVERGEVLRRFEGYAGSVSPNSLSFSPDGKYALVGSGDVFGVTDTISLVLWDIETGQRVHIFEGHRSILRSVAFSPDGRLALSGSQGDIGDDLLLWDVETGKQIRRFDTDDDITSIVFSTDGRLALTGSVFASNLTLWDVATGQQIRRFDGPVDLVLDVAFGPDEQTVLSASSDGSLTLWDVETGEVIRRYLGHDNWVWSLDVSPDGHYLISSDEDGTIILWDFEAGEELRRFKGHVGLVAGLVFGLHGQTAYSVALDGALIEWQIADLPLDELIDWTYANRYVRELTCDERAKYNVEPLCE